MQGVVSVIPSAMEYQNSLAIVSPKSISKEIDSSTITRNDFPDDFLFGTSTSAYQVEGCAAKDGRSPTIWDCYSMLTPAKIEGGSNGNVAADMYAKYKEDIIAMKNMGFDAYRFSICWTRILPGGHRNLGVNREGIKFYSDLIDMIIANGMEPFVTVFHFDFPQVLQAEYGGFLSKKVVKDFRDYAEVCFWEFGDRVKYWILINEPWTYAVNGYVLGTFPPGQASAPAPVIANNIHAYRGAPHPELIKKETKLYTNFKPFGDPGTDVYTVGRNLLLAQAAAAQSYRTKFQARQKGKIGISLNCNWYTPYTDSEADIDASKRAVDFMIGWFLSPLLTGKYPQTMIDNVQDNLAPFTDKESDMLKGSLDFLGLNYYTAMYVKDDPKPPEDEQTYYKDMHLKTSVTDASGHVIGPQAGSPWLYIVPWAFYSLLMYLKDTYKTKLPPIYITENGVDEKNNLDLTSLEACVDPVRIKYHQDHLAYLLKAMENSDNPVDVRGYFIWSYCDNYEWNEGYTVRFGITLVDYRDDCKRYPKDSAMWFCNFLSKMIEESKKRRIENSSEDHGAVKKLRATEE